MYTAAASPSYCMINLQRGSASPLKHVYSDSSRMVDGKPHAVKLSIFLTYCSLSLSVHSRLVFQFSSASCTVPSHSKHIRSARKPHAQAHASPRICYCNSSTNLQVPDRQLPSTEVCQSDGTILVHIAERKWQSQHMLSGQH